MSAAPGPAILDQTSPAAGAPLPGRAEPIVVLTYPYAGAERLRVLLADSPGLTCTVGSGLIPLCEQARLSWQQAEGLDGPPSALALKSIRALVGNMITLRLAREGGHRWGEIATAPPEYAATFLRAFPGSRFLCLHRNCADVIRLALRANPWGLTGRELAPYIAAYAGQSVAALTAYWVSHTAPLLEFEASHPGAVCRVRYEDLGRTDEDIMRFLSLAQSTPAMPGWPDETADDMGPEKAADIPVDQVPPLLRSEADDLLARLSYPPLGR